MLLKASLSQSPLHPHLGLPDLEMLEVSLLDEGTQVKEMELRLLLIPPPGTWSGGPNRVPIYLSPQPHHQDLPLPVVAADSLVSTLP